MTIFGKPFRTDKRTEKLIRKAKNAEKCRAPYEKGDDKGLFYGISRTGASFGSYLKEHPYMALGIAGMLLFSAAVGSCISSIDDVGTHNLDERLSNDIAQKNNIPDKYALIVSGKTDPYHIKNMGKAYDMLLENGFEKEDIFVLDDRGAQRREYPVDSYASRETLAKVMKHLSKKIGPEDTFFAFISDHGGMAPVEQEVNGERKIENTSYIKLSGDIVTDREFGSYTSLMKPGQGFLLADQCHSGGFAEEIGKQKNFTAVAASAADKPAYAGADITFGSEFLDALTDPQSDIDKDGRVSVAEAYSQARIKHRSIIRDLQSPFIVSDKSPQETFIF